MRQALEQATQRGSKSWTSWTDADGTAPPCRNTRRACSCSQIPTDKIRDLIGPGGKKIRGIIEATGVKIDVMDDGKVHVFAADGGSADAALQMIRDVTATAEIGKTYLGKVVRLADFGAFVEIFPGTDGLLHISEIAEQRIRDVRDELKLATRCWSRSWPSRATRSACRARPSLREQREKQQKETSRRAGLIVICDS